MAGDFDRQVVAGGAFLLVWLIFTPCNRMWNWCNGNPSVSMAGLCGTCMGWGMG
jgi:hypothetical protein